MNIKKKIIIFALCILIFTAGFTSKQNTYEHTLKESFSIALNEAEKILPNAKLYHMSSLDDINAKPTNMGIDGKRHKWNFDFNEPNTSKHVLITLYSGKIKNLMEVDGVNIPEDLIDLKEIVYDSPKLVEKAKRSFSLTAGKT